MNYLYKFFIISARILFFLLLIIWLIWLLLYVLYLGKALLFLIKLLLTIIFLALGLGFIVLIPISIIWLISRNLKAFKQNKFELKRTIILPILTVLTGIAISFGLQLGFSNTAVNFALMSGGIPLTTLLLYPSIKHRKLILKYRDNEQNLINP